MNILTVSYYSILHSIAGGLDFSFIIKYNLLYFSFTGQLPTPNL